jgi:hypothetical protein
MTPDQLLAEADRLLTTVVPGTRGRWPRACAWLIRLALEQALDDYWARVLPEAASCGMRAQLLLLPAYAGGDIAQRAREAWTGLAQAGHHHAYDLAPTAAELRGWHSLVSQLATDLAASSVTPLGASETPDMAQHSR